MRDSTGIPRLMAGTMLVAAALLFACASLQPAVPVDPTLRPSVETVASASDLDLVAAAVCCDLDAGEPIAEVISRVQDRVASDDAVARRLGAAALMQDAVTVVCPHHLDAWRATELYTEGFGDP